MNFRFIFFFSFISIWFQQPASAETQLGDVDQQINSSLHSPELRSKVWPLPSPTGESPLPNDQELPDQDEKAEDAPDDTHPYTGGDAYEGLNTCAVSFVTRLGHLVQSFNNWSTLPLFVLHHSWKSFLS